MTVTCPECGVDFSAYPSEKRVFCGRDCADKNRAGRTPVDPEVRFWAKVRKTRSCWLWTGYANPQGYGRFGLIPGEGLVYAHRAAWYFATGTLPPAHDLVCHSCDNPGCVRFAHLFIGTPADNAHDRDTKGRHVRLAGSRNGNAKLAEHEVRAIRSRYSTGTVSQRELAEAFGVHLGTVKAIVQRRAWRHVTP